MTEKKPKYYIAPSGDFFMVCPPVIIGDTPDLSDAEFWRRHFGKPNEYWARFENHDIRCGGCNAALSDGYDKCCKCNSLICTNCALGKIECKHPKIN